MIVYRIAKEKWIKDLFGIGAKISGGRWNPKGVPVIYCASTSSLAILEKLVNVDYDLLPDDYFMAEVEVPDSSILRLQAKDLPDDWNQYPSPDKLKDLGKEWIDNCEYLVLEVASAVNPLEVNYLLNVQHPLMKKVKIKEVYPVLIDERLTK